MLERRSGMRIVLPAIPDTHGRACSLTTDNLHDARYEPIRVRSCDRQVELNTFC